MSIIIENRKARFNYTIEETIEAGIVLLGSEVKSIKNKNVSIIDAFVILKKGEVYALNVNITRYDKAYSGDRYDPNRDKKLLLNKKQISKLFGKSEAKGFTIILLDLHLKRGLVKATVALAKGKTLYDKRETIKKRDLERISRKGFE